MTIPKIAEPATLTLPPAMEALFPMKNGIVIISGPDYSGKSTTMRLLEEGVRKKYSSFLGVVNVDFKDNGINKEQTVVSLMPFGILEEVVDGVRYDAVDTEELQDEYFTTMDAMNPFVVFVDNIPVEFMEVAFKLAMENDRLVIVSIHADSAQQAWDIFIKESFRSGKVSLADMTYMPYVSICQHATKDAETGEVSIQTETIDPFGVTKAGGLSYHTCCNLSPMS